MYVLIRFKLNSLNENTTNGTNSESNRLLEPCVVNLLLEVTYC